MELLLFLHRIGGKTIIFFQIFSLFFPLIGKSIKMLVLIVMFMCRYSDSLDVG